VGPIVINLRQALVSTGSGAELNLYVLLDASLVETYQEPAGVAALLRSVRFPLEDEEAALSERALIEFDYYYQAIPEPLVEELSALLVRAVSNGAEIAWFGLEGSFDFRYLLDAQVAPQIYGVATSKGEMHIALDDELRVSAQWADVLVRIRGQVPTQTGEDRTGG
jgi:hypothetical protein